MSAIELSPHATAVALADRLWDWTYDRSDARVTTRRVWAGSNGLPTVCEDDCPCADEASTPVWRVLRERVLHGTRWMTNDPHLTWCEVLDADVRFRFWERAHVIVHNGSIRFGVNA